MDMYVLVLLLVCGGGALVTSQQLQKQFYELEHAESYFQEFIQTYGRHYASEHDKQERFAIFKQNLVKINELNQRSKHAVFGITFFSDFTTQEYKTYTGVIKMSDGPSSSAKCEHLSDADVTNKDAPDAFDWRDKHAVTGVKDQNVCGASWAFSATGNVEAQHAMKHGEIVELSVQQLIDCDLGSSGCDGGYVTTALSMLVQEGGSETSADYPYTLVFNNCKFDQNKIRVKVTGCKAYNITDQEVLKELLYQTGPLSISINGDHLRLYKGGIVDLKCDDENTGLGALLVGYGTESDIPYWIVKNSWGVGWGEKGYFRLRRGKRDNVGCMLNDYVVTAAVD